MRVRRVDTLTAAEDVLERLVRVVALPPPRGDEGLDVGPSRQAKLFVDYGVVPRVIEPQRWRVVGVGIDAGLVPGVRKPGIEERGLYWRLLRRLYVGIGA